MSQLKEINDKYYQEAKVVMITTNKFTLTTLCKCIRVNGLLMDALKLNHLSKPLTEEELEDANHGKDVIGIDRYFEAQHLYIISDDEIKENNTHFYNPHSGQLHISGNHTDYIAINKNGCKKIIATTDVSLGLPQPSQQFIQKYVDEYNKGNIITNVLVEYNYFLDDNGILPYWNLKVNPKDNTITIKKVKDSYTREEVENLIYSAMTDRCYTTVAEWKKWIEENL